MKKTILTAVLALAGLVACNNAAPKNEESEMPVQENAAATAEQAEEGTLTPLDGMTFELVELNAAPFAEVEGEEKPSIVFDEGRVSAWVGCNRIMATYAALDGGEISFDYGASTKMACPEGTREDEFVEAFNKVVRYELADGVISFFDADAILLFKGVAAAAE